MFLQRAIITLTLGPLALYVIYLGGWYYFLPMAAVLLLATVEYERNMQKIGWRLPLSILIPAVLLQLIAGFWPALDYSAALLALSLLAALAYALWLYEKNLSQTALIDWLALTAGIILLGWLGSHFFRIRSLETMAWQWTLLAMLSVWIADSGAYLVGRFLAGKVIGRHRLSPRLSPNKTVEGYIGGIILGTAITLTVAYFIQIPLSAALSLSLLVSIFSPLGDLGISMIKREAGVKDSGFLFPGHGGALDRLDSLVWAVTIAYYLARFYAF